MTEFREIEAKFEIDAESIERLASLDEIGGFRVASRKHVSQHDRYFDTRAGDLAQARTSFRVRRKASGAVITFKGSRDESHADAESHFASRLEDEIGVDVAIADRLWLGAWSIEDAELSPVRRARGIGRGELLPTAEIRNDRLIVVLARDDGQELELAVDTCVGTRMSDDRVTTFNELELEAKRADHESLVHVATALQSLLPGIQPNHRTKLERVLR